MLKAVTHPLSESDNPTPTQSDITMLLKQWGNGDEHALHHIINVSYQQLSQLSRRLMSKESSQHTLQTEALLHEAYFRLHELKQIQWRDRKHFFGVWRGIMHRILIDASRYSQAHKRGGKDKAVPFEDYMTVENQEVSYHRLYEAIDLLRTQDECKAMIVELRFFTGFSITEISTVLNISPATVKRKWAVAKAWLSRELSDEES